ncbi:hypothetical protein TNCV_2166511 [Trichonephila clavipes]|nr:hypothetical protein TNCV_2166511 [Trichonephila clavipes]
MGADKSHTGLYDEWEGRMWKQASASFDEELCYQLSLICRGVVMQKIPVVTLPEARPFMMNEFLQMTPPRSHPMFSLSSMDYQPSLKRRFLSTATAGSDVVQSGRPIFDDFFQHLWPYIGNNTANVVLQMVKRLWLIRVDQ